MAQQNPLLGSKISLISKKNIRYEGILYSINEANSTVALQNVKSFGTEGRERDDPETAFVAPQEGIHAYLMFRGCDIKDLHVHEPRDSAPPATPSVPPPEQGEPATAKAPPRAPPASDLPAPPQQSPTTTSAPASAKASQKKEPQTAGTSKGKGKENQPGPKKSAGRGRGGAQVGTGASLLNRKARGSVQRGPGPETPEGEFDFQAKLNEFEKDPDAGAAEEEDDEAGDEVAGDSNNYYEKDDFFDSISCDALDKQQGIDNRLRGKEERNLNTETFGAVALNTQRRRRGRGGGRGGYGGGRGAGGRGRGRGRRGGGRGRGRYNNNNNNNNNNNSGVGNRSNNKPPVQPAVPSS